MCCGPCVSSEVSSSAKMRLMPGSPRPVLPAILALTLAAFLPQLSSGATPFPQDLEPISVVGRECKFKICVAMVIRVSGVDVKVESLRYYLITGEHGLERWMCLRACLQQVNLHRGLFTCQNIIFPLVVFFFDLMWKRPFLHRKQMQQRVNTSQVNFKAERQLEEMRDGFNNYTLLNKTKQFFNLDIKIFLKDFYI